MKNFLTLFCIVFLNLSPNTAQVSEHSLAFGFYNYPFALERLSNGHFVVVGRGAPTPDATQIDTIFVIILDFKGNIIHRHRLLLPYADVHQVEDVVAVADGGFVISVNLMLCDANFGRFAIQRYDSTGQLIWSQAPNSDEELCSRLVFTADGILIGTDGHSSVYKFDINTGATLAKYSMESEVVNFFSIYDFRPVLGYGGLLAVGWPDFQFWRLVVSDGQLKYKLFASSSLPNSVTPQKIIGKLDAYHYAFEKNNLYRFTGSQPYEKVGAFTFEIQDAIIESPYIYLLGRQDSVHVLVKTNVEGHILLQDTLSLNQRLSSHLLSFQNGTFAVAGIDRSGQNTGIIPWLYYNATNVWFRTFTNPTESPIELDNAALSGVIQDEPVTVSETTVSWPPGIRYTIEGGNFSILVSNQGQSVLDEVDVLVGFEWNDIAICHERPAIRKRFTQLALMPGASKLLDFGNVYAGFQPEVPDEICFWTAAPNEHPDSNPDDDIYCHKIVVNVNEPQIKSHFRISPNPADELIRVEILHKFDGGNWHLSNTTGHITARGTFMKGEQILEVRTKSLPAGFYFLTIGGLTEKLVIAH